MSLPYLLALVGVGCLNAGCIDQTVLAQRIGRKVATAPDARRYSLVSIDGSPTDVAQKVIMALDARDYKTLLRYAHPDEIRALGLTEKKLEAFANLYWKERDGFDSRGIMECRESRMGGGQCTELVTDDLHEQVVTFMVYPTNAGPRCCLTANLQAAFIQLRMYKAVYVQRVKSPPGHRPTGVLEKAYRDLRAELEPAGFDGLVFVSDLKGKLKKTGWDTLIRGATLQLGPRRRMTPQRGRTRVSSPLRG